jgi:hypothetical protein
MMMMMMRMRMMMMRMMMMSILMDLKTVVQLAGIEGHPIVLYIEDRQVGDDDDDDDDDD